MRSLDLLGRRRMLVIGGDGLGGDTCRGRPLGGTRNMYPQQTEVDAFASRGVGHVWRDQRAGK